MRPLDRARPVDRTRLGLEVVIVLGLSLGQSAVYSVLRIIERLTRAVPLSQQTSTLNASATPDRPWLDLTYQLVGIAFALVPVLLVLYLLNLTNRPGRPADRARPAPAPVRPRLRAADRRWASASPGSASTSAPARSG